MKKLEMIRKTIGLTQEKASEKVGVDRTTWQNWEATGVIPQKRLKDVIVALNLNAEQQKGLVNDALGINLFPEVNCEFDFRKTAHSTFVPLIDHRIVTEDALLSLEDEDAMMLYCVSEYLRRYCEPELYNRLSILQILNTIQSSVKNDCPWSAFDLILDEVIKHETGKIDAFLLATSNIIGNHSFQQRTAGKLFPVLLKLEMENPTIQVPPENPTKQPGLKTA